MCAAVAKSYLEEATRLLTTPSPLPPPITIQFQDKASPQLSLL
ncbi:hypothetical protein E2C01_091316 [Portunus trituberculatus]|uniref:Uncharacterized protein n=1 Tax=Portunus trituberculatus TaxID=210409 RepID=A0A5B7JMM6_PORTR|nr:hypothetical protein [Portunus trituberculatus]